MNLEDVLVEISQKKVIAEQDLDLVDPRVRSYKKGQIDAAKKDLENLYLQYKNEMLKRSVIILVSGDEADKFSDIAKEEYKVFTSKTQDLPLEVVNQLSGDLYLHKNTGASLFDIIDNVLEGVAHRLDILSYNSLGFKQSYLKQINSKGELIELLEKAIVETVGSELIVLDALEKAAKEGVNLGYKSRIVPILLQSNNPDILFDIRNNCAKIGARAILVQAGPSDKKSEVNVDEVNIENVGSALKQIATQA